MDFDIQAFRTRFSAFSDDILYSDDLIFSVANESILLYLGNDVLRWVNQANYDLAQRYIVAHLLTMSVSQNAGDSGSKSGSITSKSAGGVSVSKSTVSTTQTNDDLFFNSTSYGQMFVQLRNRLFIPVLVTGGGF